MNARERFFAVMNGEPTDHVPIWLLFPYHTTSYYADVRSEPSYRAVLEASKRYAITLNRRNPEVKLFGPEVREWKEELREGADSVERSCIEYQGQAGLRRDPSQLVRNTAVKRLLCDDDDLEFFCSLPMNDDPPPSPPSSTLSCPPTLQEVSEFPIEHGAMMLDLGEPVSHLYHASKLEEYAIWSLTHSDLIVDFLEPPDGAKAAGLPATSWSASWPRSTFWSAASWPARRWSAARPFNAGSCPTPPS